MLGPPGAGKSMLARRLTTILPDMTLAEALETTRIHRVAGLTGDRTALVTTRPFRAPHHAISDAGLIGGGQIPMPGEVSLAHHGVFSQSLSIYYSRFPWQSHWTTKPEWRKMVPLRRRTSDQGAPPGGGARGR
jgi:Magnesium chelatase, subunit ChlI